MNPQRLTVRRAACGVRRWFLHSAFRIPHSAWKRGQSLIEYVALFVIVVAALVAMAIYSKRGVSGYLRGAADGMGAQYAPRHTTSTYTTKTFSSSTTTSELTRDRDLDRDGTIDPVMVTTSVINAADHDGDGDLEGDTTVQTGTETVGPLGTNLWER